MEKKLWDMHQGVSYDSYEILSSEQREEIKRENLKNYFEYATKNSFYYSNRIDQYQIDLNSNHPLKNVPILTSLDLREHLPPENYNLLGMETKDFTVFQSGGTTGTPKTSLFSHEELEGLNHPNARGFYAVGLNPQDRVANLFAVGGLYMTFLHINRMLQQYGCMNFPFSNNTPPLFVGNVAKLFNINTFTGITSVVLSTLREIYEKEGPKFEVEKLFYGGEHIYESDILEMKKKFNVKDVFAPGYGTVDTWYIGYQCKSCPHGVFHAHDDECYLEIVNEDGELCKDNEVGILYATAFPRKLTPIIRYNIGDKAYWVKEKCSCGRTTPRFKLLGRGDDVLRIGYDSIDYNALQNLILKFPDLSGSAQMEKRRVDGKDQLVIRIESEKNESEFNSLKKTFSEALLIDRPTLAGFVKKGAICPIEVEILKVGSIKRNPRTGKLTRVIDCI